jgi:nucleoredoxin
MAFVELFGETLLSKRGEVATKDVVAGKKHVMIYFSAHWCPPCREFTPQLAAAYRDSPVAGKDVVVIFVSKDNDQADFEDYYKEMPWHALPFSKRDEERLSKKYGVDGIPTLIVLDGDGKLNRRDGRSQYKQFLGATGDLAKSREGGKAFGKLGKFAAFKKPLKGKGTTGKGKVKGTSKGKWLGKCKGTGKGKDTGKGKGTGKGSKKGKK